VFGFRNELQEVRRKENWWPTRLPAINVAMDIEWMFISTSTMHYTNIIFIIIIIE
jgi:hypothetical protein